MTDAGTPELLVGSDILGLITVGMYDNPLAIYREYLQNAADAISTAGNVEDGEVQIEIDPSRLAIRIRDNGPGLPHEAAVRALLPIALSQKRRRIHRGFRGVGRLSGLAFADSVTFLTRARIDQPVTRIVWDGTKVRNRIVATGPTERAIRECVSVTTLLGREYPSHFFEVEVNGVARHAAGLILNREVVRNYIGEVCPVPIDPTFSFVSEIDGLFEEDNAPLVLNVVLDGDSTPVTRRFGGTIRFLGDREDHFTEFEEFHVPSVDGNGNAAEGWVAHSSYLGAIPKETGIRGIRARAGNIQIGDETVFDLLFPEERFNRWCVGEFHVTDPRIVPNGRRDYFEPGPHIRNLENHLGAVVRNIVARCRKASTTRNNQRKVLSTLCEAEEAYDLAVSGYLFSDDAAGLVARSLERIHSVQRDTGSLNGHAAPQRERLAALETKLNNFRVPRDCPPFRGIPASDAAIYRKIFRTLALTSRSPRTAKETMETILAQTC